MIAGIRSDDDSVIGQHTSSRLGFVGQVFEDTVVKLLYGSSFQAPSPELLYRTAVQAGDIIGNPNLDAQTADTYEISFSRPFGSYVYASLTYFYTEVDKLVVFNSDGSNLFAQNSASHETEGVETELRLIWKDVNAFFNFSWQESRRGSSEFSLYKLERRPTGELFPKGMANIGLSYYWQKPEINLSFTTRWVDKRPASSSNVLLANQVYHLDPYWLSNFTVSSERWSLVEGYTTHLRMHIRDLFDHNPVTPGFGGVEFPGAGRQLMFSIEQEF